MKKSPLSDSLVYNRRSEKIRKKEQMHFIQAGDLQDLIHKILWILMISQPCCRIRELQLDFDSIFTLFNKGSRMYRIRKTGCKTLTGRGLQSRSIFFFNEQENFKLFTIFFCRTVTQDPAVRTRHGGDVIGMGRDQSSLMKKESRPHVFPKLWNISLKKKIWGMFGQWPGWNTQIKDATMRCGFSFPLDSCWIILFPGS